MSDSFIYRETRVCRACLSRELAPVLDLGNQFIVEFPEKSGQGQQAPLSLVMCSSCKLVQLAGSVRRDLLYRNYYYRSGISRTMQAALKDIVENVQARISLYPGDEVLDIGSNDGTLLSYYPSNVGRIAVDPSDIADRDVSRRIKDYFSYETIRRHGYRKGFKAITSVAMFYDVERPLDFALDVADLLTPDGIWVNQLNHAPLAVENNAFDFISHEHLTYFTTATMHRVIEQAGLEIVEAQFLPLNGGTVRYYITHRKASFSFGLLHLLSLDHPNRYDRLETWQAWGKSIADWRIRFWELIRSIESKIIFVLGASTRGNVILQYAGIDVRHLPYAADADSRKHGRYMVGVDIPIVSLEAARAMYPDYFLVLPYSYLDELILQEKEFRDRGGRFIVPLPEPRIV